MSNMKNTLPDIPRKNETAWILTRPPVTRPTCYPAVSGGKSVIRLRVGKLLVNLLQVVQRTDTPLIPEQMALRGRAGHTVTPYIYVRFSFVLLFSFPQKLSYFQYNNRGYQTRLPYGKQT